MVTRYLEELTKEWFGVALLIADVVIFAISAWTQSFTLPREFYWAVAGVAFVIANYRIYKRLQGRIDRYERLEPNIWVEFLESKIVINAPAVTDYYRFDDGLNNNGLPVQPVLQAKMKIENIGRQIGTVQWIIALKESVIPRCFEVDILQAGYREVFEGDRDVKIDDKSSLIDTWSLPLTLRIQDAKELASYLANPDSYSFSFHYSLQGNRERSFPTTEIKVEGDLESFKQSLIKKWERRGMSELVGLAQGHNWDTIG